ncbi:MAG TPA: LacI family DNA-binding transcriptional regulator [Balneolales bacterium]|nr:LacI family DNA-binding transcriptional regulator [Balneolales bacterium]
MNNRITIRQIARELGISAMTVSRALNNRSNVDENTRKRVLETAKRMGYKPNHIARSLTTKRTFTIGVVLPKMSHSFFPDAIRGIEEIAYQKNYQLILTHSSEDATRETIVIESLVSKRVDGILISSAQNVKDLKHYNELLESNYPVVFFDRWMPGLAASSVRTNDEECAMLITRHLIEKHGYTKIAHISGPGNVSIGADRLMGFRRAMEEARIPIHKNWIVEAGFDEKTGYDAAKKLLSLPKEILPEAIFAVNDSTAFGAMEAIYEEELKIPDDIAIVGFSDDKQDKLLNPPLTTVHQPAYEEGKRATQILIDMIEGKSKSIEDVVVKSYLVIRKSCGCK